MKYRIVTIGVLLALAILLQLSIPAIADEKPLSAECTVTYVTASSVYLDAGEGDGLRVGDLVELLSGDQVVAVLTVLNLTSSKASCTAVNQNPNLFSLVKVGDRVRYDINEPATAPGTAVEADPEVIDDPQSVQPPTVSAGAIEESGPSGNRPDSRINGRIGLGYLTVIDRINDSGGFTQPAVTARLDGTNIGGSPISLYVDSRIRRTDSSSGSASESRNGLYRASLEWQRENSPYHISLGRQFSPALSGISLFDGLLAERRTDRWAFGLFAGTQPDPQTYAFANDTTEYGIFAQRTSQPQSKSTWELTSGLVGTYGIGEEFREFLFFHAHYFTRQITLSLNQEMDFNRSWKSEAEQSAVSLTNTFATVNIRAGEILSFNIGYDDRRSVLTYREFINPETEFDDDNRRGLWTGVEAKFLDHYRIGVRYQGNTSSNTNSSASYTINLGAQDLFPFHLDLATRSTRFDNVTEFGWLHTLAFYLPVGKRTQLGLHGGQRQDETSNPPGDAPADTLLRWYGMDINLRLGRSWLFLLSAERNVGEVEEYDQLYTTLTFRF